MYKIPRDLYQTHIKLHIEMYEYLNYVWDKILFLIEKVGNFLSAPLFHLGNSEINMGTLFYFFFAFYLLFFISRLSRNLFVKKILGRSSLAKDSIDTIAIVIQYLSIFIGSLVIIQAGGIDLSSLGLLAGALGVGIGFGLQNIADNFISGIIILFEKPIKIGDRIVVGDTEGNVTKISVRATTIMTNDNIAIIVPNSELISSRVINWSHSGKKVRFKFPVGVSYKEDPETIRSVLIEAANEDPDVLDYPTPYVFFDEYGESSLNFSLAIWTSSYIDIPNKLKTKLYFAIFKKFKERGIEIPFPQRDIHLKSGIIRVKNSDK